MSVFRTSYDEEKDASYYKFVKRSILMSGQFSPVTKSKNGEFAIPLLALKSSETVPQSP